MIELPLPPSADDMLSAYQRHKNIWKAGAELGVSGHRVYRAVKDAGVTLANPRFTDKDRERLRLVYREYLERGELEKLAAEMGRSKSFICAKARELGLTDSHLARQRAANIGGAKRAGTQLWDKKPHPRGFAGKNHTAGTKALVGAASQKFWDGMSEDERSDLASKQLRGKVAKYGHVAPNVKRGSWKAAWREIGGQRKYFRSRWEANYARYLQWLKDRGDIADWQHEPETFWFEGIKRGTRSYLPDFRVTNNDGSIDFHEVKGWEDARSKTIFKRMAKYHPEQRLIIIRAKGYNQIERALSRLIEGWE